MHLWLVCVSKYRCEVMHLLSIMLSLALLFSKFSFEAQDSHTFYSAIFKEFSRSFYWISRKIFHVNHELMTLGHIPPNHLSGDPMVFRVSYPDQAISQATSELASQCRPPESWTQKSDQLIPQSRPSRVGHPQQVLAGVRVDLVRPKTLKLFPEFQNWDCQVANTESMKQCGGRGGRTGAWGGAPPPPKE